MRLAVLSDIHSNYYALKAVLRDIRKEKINKIVILGDIFGYYPWATETYEVIKEIPCIIIKGNHDLLISREYPPTPIPEYWHAIINNRKSLQEKHPESLVWLTNLDCYKNFKVDNMKIALFHGTPKNPCSGRFYPDDSNVYKWFPRENEILMLGHTHYPIFKEINGGGLIINPGSVGQPRDGNPMPSWGIFDTIKLSFDFKRTNYNLKEPIAFLKKMNWDKRSILALEKNYKGNIRI